MKIIPLFIFMRYVITFLFVILASSVQAQVSFEGKIVYEMNSPEKNGTAQLTFYFSHNKIKLNFKEPNQKASDDLDATIIDLDSGRVYTINQELKTYTIKTLVPKKPTGRHLTSIAGYATTQSLSYSINDETDVYINGFLQNSKFYVADSLYFEVPEEYKDNYELLMIRDNKIVLGAEIFMSTYAGYSRKKDGDTITPPTTVMAKSVTATQLDPAIFKIPADYTIKKNIDFVTTTSDSIAAVDVTPIEPKNPATKRKPIKKTSSFKTNKFTLHRKEQ